MWLKLYFGHRLRCCQVRVFAGNSSVGTAPVLRFAIRVSPNLSMLPLHRMVSQLRSALNDGAMPIHRRYIGYSRSGGYLSAFRKFAGYRLPSHVEAGNHFGTDEYFPFFVADV